MTVTILVPIYGVEKYIAECAHSLFRQTYSDIEYVFCDDCTKDRSMTVLQQILEEYPNRKSSVSIIHNKENKGIGYTRARLLENVRTDTFCFVDSDDVLPLDSVEKLIRTIEEKHTDIVEGAYAEYHSGKTGHSICPSKYPADKYLKRIMCQNIESNRLWGKLYSSSVLEKMKDWFFEGIDYTEDLCAISRLTAICSRSWTDDVIYHYRTDNISSYTKNVSEKNILSYFRSCGKVLSFYHRRGHLPFALEIGMLNAYRECRRSGISTDKADEILRYVPQHIRARMLYWMFCNKSFPLVLSDYLYRLFRLLAI